MTLLRRPRLLLWDYDRGSMSYDLAWIVILLFLFLGPDACLSDPMRVGW